MKFDFQYRTSDNALHVGQVAASTREEAFRLLKERGIKPAKLIAAPGFFNTVLGKGKRWIAIGFLSVFGAIGWVFANRAQVEGKLSDTDVRSQVYGDPSLLSRHYAAGWLDVFADQGDAWLARYSQPGVEDRCAASRRISREECAGDLRDSVARHCPLLDGDTVEVTKMKRIINGMKDELMAYLKGGGTVEDYMALCEERIKTEVAFASQIEERFSFLQDELSAENRDDIEQEWESLNQRLRALGLRTKPFPENE